MADITLQFDLAGNIEVVGENFERDVPYGMHIEYKPDDHSVGRTGNLCWIPGPETEGGPGQITGGLYVTDEGTLDWHFRRRMVVTAIPGTFTATVYQDPELLGQEHAAQASIRVVS